MKNNTVIIRTLGLQHYIECWNAMQHFTGQRDENTPDEIWFLEHPPVFTQGQNGKPEHLLHSGNIPVIKTDRGGQITYHGPGQLVAYTLVDLKRKKLNIREIVTLLEKSVIDLLAEYQTEATARREAPGIYIGNKKICSVGLRIRRGCSYHGLALNVAMDLGPFKQINPCGSQGLEMTQFSVIQPAIDIKTVEKKLAEYLTKNLGYTNRTMTSEIFYAPRQTS